MNVFFIAQRSVVPFFFPFFKRACLSLSFRYQLPFHTRLQIRRAVSPFNSAYRSAVIGVASGHQLNTKSRFARSNNSLAYCVARLGARRPTLLSANDLLTCRDREGDNHPSKSTGTILGSRDSCGREGRDAALNWENGGDNRAAG